MINDKLELFKMLKIALQQSNLSSFQVIHFKDNDKKNFVLNFKRF